jgi:HlyD family secretion protein
MNMKKIVIIGLVVTAIASTGFYLKSTKDGDVAAKTVELSKVTQAQIIQKVNATGKIQPKTKINISADVSAKIIQLQVKEGDWVEKGTLLVKLDNEKYLATVESQEADVRASQANAKLVHANMLQAQRVWHRAQEMFDKKLDSKAQLDATDAAYQVEVARYEAAQQQVEQSKGTLKRARDDLSKTTMYAPMAGTISKLNKEVGEIAIGSQFQEDVIMTIANLTKMEALVNVDENDITAIALGQDAEIEVDAIAGQLIQGKITEISTSANEATNGDNNQKTEFAVTIAITNENRKLRPGMTASADIITDIRDDALSVPIQSVTVRTAAQLTERAQDKNKQYSAGKDGFVEVVFVEQHGQVTARQVKTGIQSSELIEIVDGLALGEAVVSGSYRAISRDLNNGDLVELASDEKKAEVH